MAVNNKIADVANNVLINMYGKAIQLAAIKNAKAKQWFTGRLHWESNLQKALSQLPTYKYCIWIHCASLGEFEQARPVIDALKKHYKKDVRIILSFFSPSGYTVRHNYSQADYVAYLPLANSLNAEKWVQIIKPDMAIFVKYEFWRAYFVALQNAAVPLLLISAIFRDSQAFFKWYGSTQRSLLQMVNHFFVQNTYSAKLLQQLGIPTNHISIAGDTRCDRVVAQLKETTELPQKISDFIIDTPRKNIIVVGSSWPKDEVILLELMTNLTDLKAIIAPHEIDATHISAMQDACTAKSISYELLSSLQTKVNTSTRVLIIDSIGLLSKLYALGGFAYIGGGFGKGIHNILEAAVYGVPLFFGPKHSKFYEAISLKKAGAAFSIQSAGELEKQLKFLQQNTTAYKKAATASATYVQQQKGATNIIMRHIIKYLEVRENQ